MPRHRATLLPPARRTRRFSLIPLADTMFQLLIFFMLSSGLTPYSLLGFGQVPAGPEAHGAGNGSEPASAAGSLEDRVLWRITAGGLSFNAQHFEFSELEALSAGLSSRADPVSVVLIPEAAARIQDIVSVMAALNAAGVETVQLGISPKEG
ncbi:ExbD/TolR family protein [Tritonibacter scottomollicae]|uniref:ExbD/TolR family protein n=1 Tax=Tritonibacter scottomollicae TaxID=483013 RepID=UPI003AA920EB